jgi:hypothetical protein
MHGALQKSFLFKEAPTSKRSRFQAALKGRAAKNGIHLLESTARWSPRMSPQQQQKNHTKDHGWHMSFSEEWLWGTADRMELQVLD